MNLFIFPFFYIKEIIVGSTLVTRDSLFPGQHVKPIILPVDTEKLTLGQRYVLACLISMTPGTLSVGESEDGNTMFVHCLYGDDAEQITGDLQKKYVDTMAKLPI